MKMAAGRGCGCANRHKPKRRERSSEKVRRSRAQRDERTRRPQHLRTGRFIDAEKEHRRAAATTPALRGMNEHAIRHALERVGVVSSMPRKRDRGVRLRISLNDAAMLPRPEEQRKFLRRPMHRAAELRFDMQEQRARCRIWDMSDGGARLSVSHPIAKLPPIFTLVLFKDASVQRDCQVVWTDSRFVGIKFISCWYGEPKPKRTAPAGAAVRQS